jgi:hypothetical protein
MVQKHSQMESIEEEDMQNRKIQDINLEIVNEHFQNMKIITEKVSGNYIRIKTQQYGDEGRFIDRIITSFQ